MKSARNTAPAVPAAMTALALSLALVCCTATTVVTIPRLPIQNHGFNEPGLWPQILSKGVRWIKMDVSYCTVDTCVAFSTYGQPGRGNASDCWANVNGTELCCMCMRGDASSRPVLYSPFNTSYDVLNFLDDHFDAPYFHSENVVHLALDYGGVPIDFFNVTESAMLRHFLLGLRDRIAQYGLQFQPYFDDEMNGFFNALDLKCFSGNCSGAELELQQLPWFSESGDSLPTGAADPYDRYRILNSNFADFPNDCATVSWNGSEVKAAAYPFMWWEPSNQGDMEKILDEWAACPSVPAAKAGVNDGMTIVSNQGPEMLETYASSRIGRGLNQLFTGPSYTWPRLTTVTTTPNAGSAYDRFAVAAVQRTADSGYDILSVGIVDGAVPTDSDVVANLSLSASSAAMPAGALVSAVAYDPSGTEAAGVAGSSAAQPFVLLAGSGGQVTAVSVNPVNGTLALALVSDLPIGSIVTAGSQVVAVAPLCPPGAGVLSCFAVAALTNASTSLVLAVATLRAGNSAVLSATGVELGLTVDKGASLAILPPLPVTAAGAEGGGVMTADGLLAYAATMTYGVADAVEAGSAAVAGANDIQAVLQTVAEAACSDPQEVVTTGRTHSCEPATLRDAWRKEVGGVERAAAARASTGTAATDGLGAFSRSEVFAAHLSVTLNMTELQRARDTGAVAPTRAARITVTYAPRQTGRGVGDVDAAVSVPLPRRLGIGSAPHVALSRYDGTDVALITNSDGTCQCGLLMNNDGTPHCMLPTPAADGDVMLNLYQSVQYLLNYNYGRLADIAAMVADPDPNNVFSMCHPTVMSGKFECGYGVSAALFTRSVVYANATEAPNNAAPLPELATLMMHDGNVLCPIQTTFICGAPEPKAGLVFDQFRLVQPADLPVA
jgi:hypothetical protein